MKFLFMLTYSRSFIGIFCLFTVSSFAQGDLKEGENKLENGKIEEAKEIFLRNASNPRALEYLGDIASFKKEWDKAIDYYKDLVKIEPDNALYNFKLGGALGMKAYYGSKFEAALLLGDIKKHLRKAAELDPTHTETRRALVELYMQIPGFIGGSKTIADSYASDLERLNPVDALLAKAYIFKSEDYKELASMKYNEALRTARKKPELITRNYLRYELGEAAAIFNLQPEAAKKMLHEYIEHYGYQDLKSPAWAYLRLAQIEKFQDNKDKALALIEKSLSMDPSFDKAIKEKREIQRL